MMWKIQQAMQDDAIRTARIHPGNRDEVFIWQNFQPASRDLGTLEKPRYLGNRANPPALSYEHVENFTKDLEVRRDLRNRASPVNRAHMRPLVDIWRIKNPQTRSYTWSQKSSTVLCRLYFWLISNVISVILSTLLEYSEYCLQCVQRDHASITLALSDTGEIKVLEYGK